MQNFVILTMHLPTPSPHQQLPDFKRERATTKCLGSWDTDNSWDSISVHHVMIFNYQELLKVLPKVRQSPKLN